MLLLLLLLVVVVVVVVVVVLLLSLRQVSKNLLGRKTGQGFYKWDGNKLAK